jgi:RecA-family ATPase
MSLTLKGLLEDPSESQPYLVYPLLPKKGRLIIGAPKKYKKSFLAMNMAYDLAANDLGRGLWGVTDATKAGAPRWEIKGSLNVLYIEQEIGKYRVRERFGKINASRHQDNALWNLHIVTKGERTKMVDSDVTGGPIMLDKDIGLQRLRYQIEKINETLHGNHVDVVFFDPIRKFHTSDEDSSTAIIPMIIALDQMQEDLGFASVFVHHTGKRSDLRSREDPESLRGSSLWYDDADSIIMMTRPTPANDCIINLNFCLRSAADPLPVKMEFDKDSYVFHEISGSQSAPKDVVK